MDPQHAQERLRIVPANQADPADLDALFGNRGSGHRCRCQRYRLARGESFAGMPIEERALRLVEQTRAGDPEASGTTGLIAYLDRTPVGWVAVAPRSEHQGLVRAYAVPWKGRDEDPEDASVWAITCVFVRAGHRKRGISRALASAAVDFARSRGARAVEAYPIATTAVIEEELHVGTVPTFAAAGMVEVAQPTKRRRVLRTGDGDGARI
ncbi:GNAT family N-acetyltransferase [Agrococcus sp. 1P02AA]|uniref:GNAT family N-acetyltransferase n=1 Tax=Agrococcus sp. 1P02AA TaxID=3132259 RepID=UPI0039A5DE91